MNSMGKRLPWTEGVPIRPMGAHELNESCVLRFGGIEISLTPQSDKSKPRSGYYPQTPDSISADLLAQFLHCSYHFVRLSAVGGGSLRPDGTWTGPVGELQKGNVDMIIWPHSHWPERMNAHKFTQVLTMGRRVTLLGMEFSQGRGAAFSLAALAATEIWVLLFVSLFAVSIIHAIENLDHWKNKPTLRSMGDSLLHCWGSLLAQDSHFSPSFYSILWLFGSWLLIEMISGEMIGIIAIPGKTYVSSLDDLIHRPQYQNLKIYTVPYIVTYTQVLEKIEVLEDRYEFILELPGLTKVIMTEVKDRKAVICLYEYILERFIKIFPLPGFKHVTDVPHPLNGLESFSYPMSHQFATTSLAPKAYLFCAILAESGLWNYWHGDFYVGFQSLGKFYDSESGDEEEDLDDDLESVDFAGFIKLVKPAIFILVSIPLVSLSEDYTGFLPYAKTFWSRFKDVWHRFKRFGHMNHYNLDPAPLVRARKAW